MASAFEILALEFAGHLLNSAVEQQRLQKLADGLGPGAEEKLDNLILEAELDAIDKESFGNPNWDPIAANAARRKVQRLQKLKEKMKRG